MVELSESRMAAPLLTPDVDPFPPIFGEEPLAPIPTDVSDEQFLPRGITRLGDGRYRARRSVGGRRQQRVFRTLNEAIEWKEERTSGRRGRELPTGVTRHNASSFRVEVMHRGTRHRAFFNDLDSAVAWRQAAAASLARGLPVPAVDAFRPVTPAPIRLRLFGEVLEAWHNSYTEEQQARRTVLPRTINLRRDQLDKFVHPRLAHLAIDEITREDIRLFRSYWAGFEDAQGVAVRFDAQTGTPVKGYGVTTVGKLLWMIWSAFEYARAQGWVSANPAHDIRPVEPRHPFRPAHKFVYVDPAAAVSLSLCLNPALRLPFWLQRLCGLRVSEAYGLLIGDVDLDLGLLHVNKQGGTAFTDWDAEGQPLTAPRVNRTKTPAGVRVVGIPPCLSDFLHWYIAEFRADATRSDPLCINPLGAECSGSYVTAVTREAARLGVALDDDPDNVMVPHDLRKSFVTDLEAVGAPERFRSFVAGHRLQGGFEGGASITTSVYTGQNLLARSAADVAARLNGFFLGECGRADLPAEDDFAKEWMTAAEAGLCLGLSSDAILRYCRSGELQFRKHKHVNQNTPAIWVSRTSVDGFADARASRITIAEAADRLGLSDSQVLKLAAVNKIQVFRGRKGMARAWVDTAGFARLVAAAGLRSEFLADHLPGSAAANRLGIKNHRIPELIEQGCLVEALPPKNAAVREGVGRHRVRWVTLASVEATERSGSHGRRHRPSDRAYGVTRSHNPDLLTYTEAAVIIGRSADWVNRLARQGTLEVVHDVPPPSRPGRERRPRPYVTRASAEAYARANRRRARQSDSA